ncbi:ribosome maturation factor RimM [Dokdonella sp.]|uniref:ribosome maturation factor RimM n=1 Tax=Dokdonella sp. TaxID=2291710 RepID=UPI0031C4D459|nr:ribosome maturation factor RimM [Dokdonella sp.]
MDAPERLVLLGRIVGVHGVRGEVKLESFTEPRERIFSYRPWLLRGAVGERVVEAARGRAQGKGLVATLPDVGDRDAAVALVGAEVCVARSALPAPAPDEYYWFDLEGLEVATLEGVSLGRVSHVIATGANDVLVVRDGERERLVPFILDRFVTRVALDEGRITVDWDPEF